MPKKLCYAFLIVGLLFMNKIANSEEINRQEILFSKSTIIIQPGIGFGIQHVFGDAKPAISGAIDYAISDEFGITFYGGFATSKEVILSYPANSLECRWLDWCGDSGYNYKYLLLSGGISYHIALSSNLDLYFKGMIGYARVSWSIFSSIPDFSSLCGYQPDLCPKHSFFAEEAHAGINYFFARRIGLFVEAGYGFETLKFGLAARL